MSKGTKATKREKEQHYFMFKGTNHTYYKGLIEVDFTPKKTISSLPTFNRDHQFYTPSFTVPVLEGNMTIDHFDEHNKKISALLEKSE